MVLGPKRFMVYGPKLLNEIPEIKNYKFCITCHSVMPCYQPYPAWDVNHPLVQHILHIGHLATWVID